MGTTLARNLGPRHGDHSEYCHDSPRSHSGGRRVDPARRNSEDYDLWLRIAASGRKLKRHDQVIARYRIRAGSLSKSGGRMEEGEFTRSRNCWPMTRSQKIWRRWFRRRSKHRKQRSPCMKVSRHFAREDLVWPRSISKASDYKHSLRLGMIARILKVCPWPVYFLFSLRSRLLLRFS